MADLEPVTERGTENGADRSAERSTGHGTADTLRLELTVWEQLL
ncbi:hypothetical protein [Arthrobacter sp. NPDC058192]